MDWERLSRSRWWLFWSTVIPALIAASGMLWLAHKLADQHAEIDRLNASLQACEPHAQPVSIDDWTTKEGTVSLYHGRLRIADGRGPDARWSQANLSKEEAGRLAQGLNEYAIEPTSKAGAP